MTQIAVTSHIYQLYQSMRHPVKALSICTTETSWLFDNENAI